MTYTGLPLYLIKPPRILCWHGGYENLTNLSKELVEIVGFIRTGFLLLSQAPHIINSVADWWSYILLTWYGAGGKAVVRNVSISLRPHTLYVARCVPLMPWCERRVYKIFCFEMEKGHLSDWVLHSNGWEVQHVSKVQWPRDMNPFTQGPLSGIRSMWSADLQFALCKRTFMRVVWGVVSVEE